jgi:hypothetical protein
MYHKLIIAIASLGAGLMLAPGDLTPSIAEPIVITERIEIPVAYEMGLKDLPLAWQNLAKCESSGRIDAVSGTRKQFQGLFQIEYPRTWAAHGGPKDLPPKAASVKQQFEVALRIYVDRSSKPWPYCGKFLKEVYGR